MKENLKRILSAVLMLAMLLTLCLPLTACNQNPPDNGGGGGGDGDGGEGGGNGKITYTVTVKTLRNMPLEGIMCYVHKGTGYNSVGRAETNEQGVATFTLDAATDYTIELDGVPDGYNVQDRYEMGTSGATITLKSAPIPADEGTIGDVPNYQLGDIIHDFTLTDVNGNEYTVSEVLAKKKLLLLNFWYNGCQWCYKEFPYMSAAYDRYSDQVEIFAINDYPIGGEYDNTANGVKNFTVVNSDGEPVTLNFPKFKVESGNTNQPIISKFDPDQNGYPVTVAIDRDGMICMVEIGGIVSTKPFVNMFDHFIAENYQQKIVESIAEFTPVETPNVSQPSSDEIAEVLSGTNKGDGRIDVFYHPETEDLKADMIWPFVITTKNGVSCVKPSNIDKDLSTAIMYAEVEMEAGDALMFDYWGSTQQGYDILYVIVDGKDIISISGENDTGDWEKACAYVARETRKYEVAFAYVKDSADYKGDDTVYIKDLRIVDKADVDVEAFIFRYAATEENAAKTEFGSYVTVVLGDDGYYHVDNKNGPLLLVNMLGYTQFDTKSTVFERLYSDMTETGYTFIIDGKEVFPAFEQYGNIASRSKMYGITPVTEELRTYLVAYTDKYRQEVGKVASENMWLQLCCYYDAYGTAKQLEDPIKGLTSFSAYDAVLGVNTEDNKVNEVVYDRLLVPRGLLYKFVATESGVYRITSNSDEMVDGWIFTGNHEIWSANSGDRTIYVDSENPERIIHELMYVSGYTVECEGCGAKISIKADATKATCPDTACGHVTTDLSRKEAVTELDRSNVSMVAYFEAGVEYYISIAFHTIEQLGSFTFDLVRVGDSYDAFVMASPGVFTYELGENGEIGSTIIGGIKAKLCDVDGCAKCIAAANEAGAPATTKYYHHLKADGSLGSVIYADFSMPTSIFSSQSIVALLNANAFNFTISETDRDALILISNMRAAGKTALFKAWDTANGKPLPKQVKEDRWAEYCMDAALAGDMSGVPAELVSTVNGCVKTVNDAGLDFLRNKWGEDFDTLWQDYKMDDVLEGIFHPTDEERMSILDKTAVAYLSAGLTYAKEQILKGWSGTTDEKEAKWASFDINNTIAGKYDNVSASVLDEAKAVAQEALTIAKSYIKDVWETPDENGLYRDFEAYWEFYQMDDIVNQVYHGYAYDRTEELASYIDKMCTDESTPERLGCVAVDETVAEILQLAIDAYTFPNIELGWLKFCYYYQSIGE